MQVGVFAAAYFADIWYDWAVIIARRLTLKKYIGHMAVVNRLNNISTDWILRADGLPMNDIESSSCEDQAWRKPGEYAHPMQGCQQADPYWLHPPQVSIVRARPHPASDVDLEQSLEMRGGPTLLS